MDKGRIQSLPEDGFLDDTGNFNSIEFHVDNYHSYDTDASECSGSSEDEELPDLGLNKIVQTEYMMKIVKWEVSYQLSLILKRKLIL